MTEIAVVGLGYVGLPLAMAFCDVGVRVFGVDIDVYKINSLCSGMSYIDDVPSDTVKRHVESSLFVPLQSKQAQVNNRLSAVDAFFICVPTPYDRFKHPDTSYIESAAQSIGSMLSKGQLVILQSTSWIGTTRKLVTPILEHYSGLSLMKDFHVAFVPERVNPGSGVSISDVPKIIGADSEEAYTQVENLYSLIGVKTHRVSSIEAAEATKLLENAFRAVNIALVNEIATLCEKMGLDMWEVIDAASTKPYGFMPFYPSAGVGGHCIPVDPYYLLHKAAEYNAHLSLVERALSINESMPQHVVGLVYKHAARRGIAIRDDNVLLIGETYKPNVRDTRNAPAGAILEIDRSFTVWDALLDNIPLEQRLNGIDVAVILVKHDGVDYQMIVDKTALVIDCCDATRGLRDYGRVVKLGRSN